MTRKNVSGVPSYEVAADEVAAGRRAAQDAAVGSAQGFLASTRQVSEDADWHFYWGDVKTPAGWDSDDD